MRKYIAMILTLAMTAVLLAGCAGTTVVYSDCTCPVAENGTPAVPAETAAPTAPQTQGAQKLGVYMETAIGESVSATAEAEGEVKADVTVVAVTVDEAGVITNCLIDMVPGSVKFGTDGRITSDLEAQIRTKGEMGADYGMVAWGGAIAEWDQQVAALANYAIGKTVEELKNGAIDETGKAPQGSDLASSATIYLGGFVSAIEKAVENAQQLGAAAGDSLKLAISSSIAKSTGAEADKEGTAQLDTTVVALTMNGDTISSCYIDAVQPKISFDQKGNITSDLSAPVLTKNQLGADYGMVAWGGAIAEWNEQAASFASYVTGKTLEQVKGIAVSESTAPAEGTDLASSVTISVGGFQALIEKAVTE